MVYFFQKGQPYKIEGGFIMNLVTWFDELGREHFQKVKPEEMQQFIEEAKLFDCAYQIETYQI